MLHVYVNALWVFSEHFPILTTSEFVEKKVCKYSSLPRKGMMIFILEILEVLEIVIYSFVNKY